MMKKKFKMELYYSLKTKKYYLPGDYHCTNCNKEVVGIGVLFKLLNDRSYQSFCFDCISGCKKVMEVTGGNIILVVLDNHLPKDAQLVIERKTPIKNSNGNETVFSMATKKDGVNVIDRTKLSGGESIVNAVIGDLNKVKEIEEKDIDKLLDYTEGNQ